MRIGFHLSIAKGFDAVLRQAKRLDCDVVQIFLKNPRSWTEKRFKTEDIEQSKAITQDPYSLPTYPIYQTLQR
jgi:endonuclease IV